MRTDWANITQDTMYEYPQFDEIRYMPLSKKVVLLLICTALPFVGSIVGFN